MRGWHDDNKTQNVVDLNSEKLEKLRSIMKEKNIVATIVFRTDEHKSEYLAPEDERLAFISEFTGSAGHAVITAETKASKAKAMLWTDSRYYE